MNPTQELKEKLTEFARQTGIHIELYDQIDSTNNRAAQNQYGAGDVIIAESQSAGRGQRGNTWNSLAGQNLTFSVVLQPDFLLAERQFQISKTAALAVADTIADLGLTPAIKWPNDIYIGNRKVTGILIENDLCGAYLCRSVIGIGLNVNQTDFDPSLPNPTSLAQKSGHPFDRADIFIRFYQHLANRYRMLTQEETSDNHTSQIDTDYLNRLYRLNKEHSFVDGRTGEHFIGTITGIRPGGDLEVRIATTGQLRTFLFKEIEYVI